MTPRKYYAMSENSAERIIVNRTTEYLVDVRSVGGRKLMVRTLVDGEIVSCVSLNEFKRACSAIGAILEGKQ
jgi:hypothetical protein